MDDLSVNAPRPTPPSDDRSNRRPTRKTRVRPAPRGDGPAPPPEETKASGDEHALDVLA